MAGVWNYSEDFYSYDIFVKIKNFNGHEKDISQINQHNLYTFKLPFLLCFELDLEQNPICRSSLCNVGAKITKYKAFRIEIFQKIKNKDKILFQEECNV